MLRQPGLDQIHGKAETSQIANNRNQSFPQSKHQIENNRRMDSSLYTNSQDSRGQVPGGSKAWFSKECPQYFIQRWEQMGGKVAKSISDKDCKYLFGNPRSANDEETDLKNRLVFDVNWVNELNVRTLGRFIIYNLQRQKDLLQKPMKHLSGTTSISINSAKQSK